MNAETFAREATALAKRNPRWTLHELVDDVFNRSIVYLEADFTLPGKLTINRNSSNNCDGANGNSWGFDDDEDRAPRLETQAKGEEEEDSVDVRLIVSYSESYRLPQVHFELRRGGGADRIFLSVDELQQLGMRGICDAQRDGTALIVSQGFCEELSRAAYSVHPCDTAGLLATAKEMNVVNGGGSCLQLILMMISPMLGAPSALTH